MANHQATGKILPFRHRPFNGMKLVHLFPKGENVLNLAMYKDVLLIITNKGTYRMNEYMQVERIEDCG